MFAPVTGNLTADPELRFTPNGLAVANFTIAENTRYFDRRKGEYVENDANFVRCTVWKELAENAAESLRKGMQVMVTGDFKNRTYESREGETRWTWEMTVRDLGISLQFGTADFHSNYNSKSRPADSIPPSARREDVEEDDQKRHENQGENQDEYELPDHGGRREGASTVRRTR